MTELLFIRHGETDWNRRACFQGQIDVPLNGTGRLQAERLGARLATEPHDLLFSSDLQRAQQTAAPLAAAWQQQPVLVPGLREQGFGEWEGLDFPTIQARYPALWPQWLEHAPDFAAPGGESAAQFHARVLSAVKGLAAQAPGRRLAVVTCCGAPRTACRWWASVPARSPTPASTGCAGWTVRSSSTAGPTTNTSGTCYCQLRAPRSLTKRGMSFHSPFRRALATVIQVGW
jgi:2,3-bisphosphoglycerate-dependent phosphoglycerate mutase